MTAAPGEITKFVKINFVSDSVAELNEIFYLDLKTPTKAILADSRGIAEPPTLPCPMTNPANEPVTPVVTVGSNGN